MMKKLLPAFFLLTLLVFKVYASPVQTETLTAAQQGIDTTTKASDVTAAAAAKAPAAEVTKLPEDQIPLSIDTSKKAADGGSTGAKAMMSMLIVLILTGSGYYFVRRYKFSNKINKSNAQIKVISQHYLGPKKSLAIIHVAGESILVGITDANISMIKSLSLIDDEVPATLPNTFGQTMAKVEAANSGTAATARTNTASANNANAGASAATQMAEAPYELDEEFSFSNVTDTVSKKIKSMRNFS